MIYYAATALANLVDFYRKNVVSSYLLSYENIILNTERSILSKRNIVQTDSAFLPQWENAGYLQLYCKDNGCFVAYLKNGKDYYVQDIIHQQEISDFNDNQAPRFSQNQDMSVFDSWEYVKDANYGFGIVKDGIGKVAFLDLNGDFLIKDNNDKPIWFEDLSVFYDSSGDDRLHAFGVLNGFVVFIYSDGTYLCSDKTLYDWGLKSVAEMRMRGKSKIILSESQLRNIIRESIIRTIYC